MSADAPGASSASGAAAGGGGGGAAERGVLVIGYGNTLRRDDGVGVRAAELLAVDPRLAVDLGLGRVKVISAYQLTPELALDIGAASLVIFMDADVRGLPGSVEVRSLDAGTPSAAGASSSDADDRAAPGASSHHVGGAELLALAAELGGHRPEALAIGIGVADLELGEGLSAAAEAALPAVVDAVVRVVAEHRGQ